MEEKTSRRRRLPVIIAAVVVAGAALVAAITFAPEDEPKTEAAAVQSSVPPAPPTSSAPAEVPKEQPKVPPQQGQEFDAWVSKTSGWLDIPLRAMTGYAKTTVAMGKEAPGCRLSWVTLAALGKIASDHGRAKGSSLNDAGVMTVPLGTVEVRDFYNKVVSVPNASGPLQLSPSAWNQFQASASGAKPDPQNIDDATLAAARALCAGGRDLGQGQTWWNAVSTLQPAPMIMHRTLATVNVYGTVGQSPQPPNVAALSAVNFAIDKIGLPYVWGGNGTGGGDPGFDCSGLTTAAYASAGVKLMRTAHTQYHSVNRVTDPQLGDLIFYGEPNTKIHHVGLYIGNQQMIDAPQTGQAVQVHTYRKQGDDYAGAGRPTA
ncbi:NlpC/P60 family protein [Amycolatopsis sp. cmx-11-32]|uniref:C40 family peptidase n=1 Tax=Amycolatopsis sp. cmx-11-32 TaxID=2785796 RepID=UPI0039E3665E